MFRVSCIQLCSSDCIKSNLARSERLIKKAVPKEIRPALPYIAAFAGQPYLAKGLGAVGTFAANNPAVTKALLASGTAAATQDNPNLLRTAAIAAAPDVLSGGLEKLGTAGNIGHSRGYHLHYEISRYGKYTDPKKYISL